jgi:hypothetical protein
MARRRVGRRGRTWLSLIPERVGVSSLIRWCTAGRGVVFLLAATSIGCLLAEFYGLCSMRAFAILILLPATALLAGIAWHDRVRGDGRLWRGVVVGAAAGLIAAVAYDVFRLPFVFARPLGIAGVVPPLNLFKVFPRFGAMLLAQPIEQPAYSLAAHLLGWAYHFSNGAAFGVMYLALIGDAQRRSWLWAVVFALGLEFAMLVTPYSDLFRIPVTATFIAATLAAHAVFGISMGLTARRLAQPRAAAQTTR